ncbi:MAG: FecR family protein [Tannerellaceae bacterium]|jgi:ferric-dicitrate binding protein FerR (iron transport regulator)|nr:FecR family protein [Tannerellaceae bacterium]
MTQRHNNDSDQAWRLLYARLERDGLLAGIADKKTARFPRLQTVGWAAAAIALLCLSTVMVLRLTDGNSSTDSPLLTLYNEEGAATLAATLEDGSVVYLADNTHLHYPRHFSEEKREVTLRGNALFDIEANPKRPFYVETPQLRIEVRGTAFHVNSGEGRPVGLSVQRGEVVVTLKGSRQTLSVGAGETATLSSNILEVAPTTDAGQFARMTELMKFKDEKLADILRIVNKRASGIRLEAAPLPGERLLTVTLSDDSPEAIARLLCAAFNLRYVKENGVLLIMDQ